MSDVPFVQVVDWGLLLEACSHSANCAEDRRDPSVVVLGHGCDARCCTTTGAWVRQYRTLRKLRSCSADKVVDVPVYAVHRWLWTSLCLCSDVGCLARGASDSVHRQSSWTFQFAQRQGAFSEGLVAMRVGYFSRSSGSSRS